MILEIKEKFASYPADVQRQLNEAYRLIIGAAEEYQLGSVIEALKWGEASFSVKGGSPVRVDWKPSSPDAIRFYFHCQTRLVETFQELYSKELEFEGKRAIVIPLNAELGKGPLPHCIKLALTYHNVKHLPLLGA